jgi:hypothetical protein
MISLHFAIFIFFKVQKVRDSQLLLSEVIPGHLYMHLIPLGQPGFQRPAQAHTYSALVFVLGGVPGVMFFLLLSMGSSLYLMSWIDVFSFQSDLNNFLERSNPAHVLTKIYEKLPSCLV